MDSSAAMVQGTSEERVVGGPTFDRKGFARLVAENVVFRRFLFGMFWWGRCRWRRSSRMGLGWYHLLVRTS